MPSLADGTPFELLSWRLFTHAIGPQTMSSRSSTVSGNAAHNLDLHSQNIWHPSPVRVCVTGRGESDLAWRKQMPYFGDQQWRLSLGLDVLTNPGLSRKLSSACLRTGKLLWLVKTGFAYCGRICRVTAEHAGQRRLSLRREF